MKRAAVAFFFALLAGCITAQAQTTTTTCSTDGGTNCSVAIPDDTGGTPGSVTSTMTVANLCTTAPTFVGTVGVNLNVTHSFVGDLHIQLTGPNSTVVDLVDRPVVAGNCGSDDIDTLIADGGVPFPCDATIPASGTSPVAPVTPLAAFTSLSTAGTWTLQVTDNANTGIGTLNDWSLVVSCAEPPTVTIVASDPTGTEGNSDPFAFTVTRANSFSPLITSTPLTVNLSFGGTASPSRYTPHPTSITIPAGQVSATAVFQAISDGIVEPPQTVIATIQPGTGYLIGTPASATATILDAGNIPTLSALGLALMALLLGAAALFVLRLSSRA